ncbi:neurensin-1-like [Dermacentor andersoni]|uniref:neurensin-1-like n=1 Tax=Dermacentor andersoni TaxID=34620 RepID=UPI0021559544|nr:neurensin-1-like [Dermacentor andersoni]
MDSPSERLLLKTNHKVSVPCPVRPPGRRKSSSRRLFGVRCHLHRFYADCPEGSHGGSGCGSGYGHGHGGSSSSRRHGARRSARVAWSVSVWLGALLFLLGVAALGVGYAAPPNLVRRPHPWRLAGLCMFCSGGSLLAAALMLAALCPRWQDEEPYAPVVGESRGAPEEEEDDLRVPVTEKITAVQPLRD